MLIDVRFADPNVQRVREWRQDRRRYWTLWLGEKKCQEWNTIGFPGEDKD